MSSIEVREVADKRTGQPLPRIEKNQAISLLVPFPVVKHLLVGQPAPRRPNRNRPILIDDPQLREELDAWEAASDEAFQGVEEGLVE
jgi:hypothetical protein